ncbi:hypothetical protein IQ267_25330 [filamentous cyanobacterium LEGE 07170]|nr:hypothetical protein [filamentous cyanobacterium LEGE 07170]
MTCPDCDGSGWVEAEDYGTLHLPFLSHDAWLTAYPRTHTIPCPTCADRGGRCLPYTHSFPSTLQTPVFDPIRLPADDAL